MIRWITLAVLVVATSIAIPVVLSALPTDSIGAAGPQPAVESDQAARKGPTGRLVVEGRPEFDFGVMAQHSSDSHDWIVKNAGDKELELSKGSSTCMCTVADFPPDPKTGQARETLTLKPGESTPLTLTWNTKTTRGRFEKSASFMTSDPQHPEFWFRIIGTVEPAIVMRPETPDFDFGNVPNQELSQAHWALSSPDRPDFQILEVASSRPDLITTNVRPLSPEEKAALKFQSGFMVEIEAKPTTELGPFQEELIVKTDHPKQPEIKATLHGNRLGPISLVPTSIRIHDANSSDGGSQTLLLTVRDQDGPTNFEVTSVPPKLQIKIEPTEGPGQDSKIQRYRLTATVPPGTPPGTSQGDLILKTNHPFASRIKIPVNIVVLSGF